MAGNLEQSDPDESQSGNPAPVLTGVSAGNNLVCCIVYGNSATITSVSSSNGGALTEGPTTEQDTDNRASIWYLENCNSGTHTVTVTVSGSNHYARAVLLEYSGISSYHKDGAGGSSSATQQTSAGIFHLVTVTYIAIGTHDGTEVALDYDNWFGSSVLLEDEDVAFMPYSIGEKAAPFGTFETCPMDKGGSAAQMGLAAICFEDGSWSLPVPFHFFASRDMSPLLRM